MKLRNLLRTHGRHRAVPVSPSVTRVASCPCRGWDRLTTHTVDGGVMTCQQCGRRTAEVGTAELEPGTRWLRCDTTICGHTTTRHTPTPVPACCDQAGPGPTPRTWNCTWCGNTKGDQ
ncbi:hypothetical protein ACIOHC_11365 [Streptomyces sp. NPDC088252]|uniref:hypothetical protein n=1 Tax=unclassified Streptomyces TaxID=2593676 RepID=UPI0038226AD7